VTSKPTLCSQAHLQVAQANTRPIPAKELAYPNARWVGIATKLKAKNKVMKNGQLVTSH